jgi:uncharacterized damage-inducible protein DinB
MDSGDFVRLFAYDHWANQECLKALGAGQPGTAVIGRMAHILSAEKLWLERIQKVPQSTPVWPGLTLEECSALADEIAGAWNRYLANLAPDRLSKVIEYRNSKGERWTSRVEDVLMHVIQHSAYHRGQIAMEMRASGMEPAYTDFIHAVRQGLVD